jgi:hypothetical protein
MEEKPHVSGKEAEEANSSGPDVEERDPTSLHAFAARGQAATDA